MKNINLKLYKLTQLELHDYIINILDSNGIEYKRHNGNIYSLRYSNKPCFVSHMDTVNDGDMKKKLYVDKVKGHIYRQNGILGADDRAGVNIILNHINDINFIFTVDEEIGCLGIQDLVKNTNMLEEIEHKNISCMIELDRAGNNDIIGAKHGYCQNDLSIELQRILNYKDEYGVLTDIDFLCESIASVNLSVGYYNAHTKNEYLNIKEYDYINSKIKELNNVVGSFEVGSLQNYYKQYYSDFKDYNILNYCESCKDYSNDTIYLSVINMELCRHCYNELINEIFTRDDIGVF